MADDRIFAELKRDHDRQRKLLDAIGETSGDSAERRTLFEELRLELQAHAAAEEESLYATMLANPDLRDQLASGGARVLGGGSSINGQMANRGAPTDYDEAPSEPNAVADEELPGIVETGENTGL